MKIKLLPKDEKLQGKRLLIRLDLNVPLKKKHIVDDYKIQAVIPTLRRLRRLSSIIIMTHIGDPIVRDEYEVSPALSVAPIASRVRKLLGGRVFVASGTLSELQYQSQCLRTGDIMFLENIRFWSGETKNNLSFARKLGLLGDIYINDAFAVSHRAHASVSAIKKCLPSYAGPLLAQEVTQLLRVGKGAKPLVVIFGGAKIKSKLPLIKAFLPLAWAILVGGDLANDLMASRHGLPKNKVLIPQLSRLRRLADIDDATIAAYEEVIAHAKTIFWNGPMGIFENKNSRRGTERIVTAIAAAHARGAFTVAGGGETIEAIRFFKRTKAFSWISTGGGASLSFLSNTPMPGLKGIIT